MIRKPAFAGAFYELNPDSLKKQIEWCFEHKFGPGKIPEMGDKRDIKGVMAPHAGYIYSGPIAAHSYSRIVEDGFPDTFIILCPNHTGYGSGISTMIEGEWETPLGNVKIDSEFAGKLVEDSLIIDEDETAHIQEHSCEVQLPFLQYFSENFKIVPICLLIPNYKALKELGESIKKTIEALGRDTVIIASSDLDHFNSQDVTVRNDELVLDAIGKMDEKLMLKRVMDLNIKMCGYGPVTSTIVASRELGAKNAQILKHATSGDMTGDMSRVVGYASAVFL